MRNENGDPHRINSGRSLGGSLVVFLAVSIYGFFMHTRLMFRPVRNPRYMTLNRAIDCYGGDETVLGVLDVNGQSIAYIARLQRRPLVVYRSWGEAPFVSTHCVLAYSSMAHLWRRILQAAERDLEKPPLVYGPRPTGPGS